MMTIWDRPAPPSRLDLWIIGTLPDDVAVDRWSRKAGVPRAVAERVVAEANAAGLGSRLVAGADRVIAHFGMPTLVRPNRLVYDLALWPAHQFVWAVSEWGDVAALGFRLRELAPLPRTAPSGVDGARAAFRLWHHTEHEVRSAWGQPHLVAGASTRSSRWTYFNRKTRHVVHFAFAWGLLHALTGQRYRRERLSAAVRRGRVGR